MKSIPVMIILHASASGGRLVLWGETSPGSPGKTSRKATGRIEPARPPRSRFALEGDRLAEAVAGEVSGFEPAKEQRQRWVAWLPSNEQGALPSSPLLTERPEDRGTVRVAPWEVPALVLTAEQAVAVLVASIDRTTWGPGVVVGKTLAYWATVLRFAGALVARQQYLPGMVAEGDGTTFRASWEPVLTGRNGSRPRGWPARCLMPARARTSTPPSRRGRRHRPCLPRCWGRSSITWCGPRRSRRGRARDGSRACTTSGSTPCARRTAA